MASGGRRQCNAVTTYRGVDLNGLDGGLHREHAGRVGDRRQRLLLLAASHPSLEHLQLLRGSGVAKADPHQKAVELGLGKGIGPLVLNRVRGRYDVERRNQREGLAFDGDLSFLHCLQQCRLRLRWRAVDLVGKEHPGEKRPLTEDKVAGSLVVDERTGQVGGKKIGGELCSFERQPEGLGE